MTIHEVGESGGPGFGGCAPGPNGVVAQTNPSAPVHYLPSALMDAANPVIQPSLKDVTVFPVRDFVSIQGFPEGPELQVVVRRGTSAFPVVGTARGIVGKSGLFEVNPPGGVCWTGKTPNIGPCDSIDVFEVVSSGFSAGQTQRMIDAKITRTAFVNANGNLRVNVTAVDASGLPLALSFIEHHIINPDCVNTRIGRRDIRADINGGRVDNIPGTSGNLLRTTTTDIPWRAIYRGLNATEQPLAVVGQSRAMAWCQREPQTRLYTP
jgi:hypothetical protein